MAKKVNKKVNKNFVYYAKLVCAEDTNVQLTEAIRVNIDYDLYESWRKAPNGDYYLNKENAKLINKTLERFGRKISESDGKSCDFCTCYTGIALHKCECGAKHVCITNVIGTSDALPNNAYIPFNLVFSSTEDC